VWTATSQSGTIRDMKKKTSYALTEGAIALIKKLAKDLGIPQASVVELAVRMWAEEVNRKKE
jgi:hypothetical protein